MKKLKIVIIGGTSDFGIFWQKYFEKKGFEVLISSRSTEIKPEEAVTMGDIIIFSVSIRYTKNLIKKLVPLIPKKKLVMDFTGIKVEASNELKKYSSGEVVATHPMFGPWIKSLKGQNIAFDPINPGKKWKIIYDVFKKDEANLIEMNSYKHDEMVAIVQSTVHFINLLLGHILQKRGIKLEDIINISTPNSRMQLIILSRFLNQKASLYTDMQIYNTIYKNEVISEIENFVKYLKDIVLNEDINTFENTFEKIKDFIGEDFLNKALKISSKIDEETKNI